ncbi:MAG: CBS domain-containing protein, partial [Planctomycetota bacterium]
DEVANAAFWIGLMLEGPHRWTDLTSWLDFRDARGNFLRAARDGLAAHMAWTDGRDYPIGELILSEFAPAARSGLARAAVDRDDIDRLIGIIEQRVATRQTGAKWILDGVATMRGIGSRSARLATLTRAMLKNQDSGAPVHEWPEAPTPDGSVSPAKEFARVSQCMTTEIYTVAEHDCLDLAASIMDWERVRHVPVEDGHHRLVGLVSYRKLLSAFTRGRAGPASNDVPVKEVMTRDPVTVTPDTPTLEAIRLMCEHGVSCLPVVEDDRLVGIVSERDYTAIARSLLERAIKDGNAG